MENNLHQSWEILRYAPDVVLICEPDGRIVFANDNAVEVLGYSLAELRRMTVLDISPTDWRARYRQAMDQVAADGKRHFFEIRMLSKSQKKIPMDLHMVRMPTGQLYGICRDITERKLATAKINESNKNFSTLIETIPDAIIFKDGEGRWLSANEPALQLFSLQGEDWLGRTDAELIDVVPNPNAVRQDFLMSDEAAWQSGKLCHFNEQLGSPRRDFEVRKMPLFDKHGVRNRLLTICRDVSQLNESKQRIHELAFYDPVTHLPNRRLLLDRVQQACAASAHSRFYGAVLSLELDSFKTVSSEISNRLLQEVAQRLTACVQEGETLACLGGDSFAILMESLSSNLNDAADQAQSLAEKISEIVNRTYQFQTLSVHASINIGIALLRSHESTPEELLRQSKSARVLAKDAGRNAILFYNPVIQAALLARNQLEHELRTAIEQQQFHLLYQAQVDSGDRILGGEVLVRWRHPQRGLLDPAEFMPLCEETGLIVPLGLWVLEQACGQLKRWQNQTRMRDLVLAVNVSAKQLHQPDFVARVQGTLLLTGARPSQLKLELTESSMLENVEDTILKMRELKLLGIHFSMDDFGTGHSSLQYLKRLPLDQIKIDQSFVRDIATNLNDAVIVKTIISMSDALGLNVIAEGVETQAQRDFLSLHGCHVYQGYLFGKPLTLAEFEKKLLGD